jgi:cytochrome c556
MTAIKTFVLAACTTVGLMAALPASAQFAKPEDAIKYRQAAFTVMGAHFGRIGAMVQGRVPYDAKVAADNAEIVAAMAKLPWAAFGEGTDKGAPHRAKPEIWREGDKVKAGADKLVADTANLATVAKAGNLDQLRTAFGAVGQSCKACHDAYRAERYSN